MDYEENAEPKDDDILHEAKEAFTKCVDAEQHNRDTAMADLLFARMGEQWPDGVKRQRERDGRPCMTFNKLPSFIRQVVNDSRMNRPAINVQPVDSGADVQTADILKGLIRNIEVTSNADVAYDTAIESAVSMGFGYFRINIDYACNDSFDLDIKIERIANTFTVYGDPMSTEADSCDWNVAFITDVLDEEDFEKQYPDADPVNFSQDGLDSHDLAWFQDNTVRVAEYWTREKVFKNVYQLNNREIIDEETLAELQPIMEAQGIQVVAEREVMSYKVMQYIINGQQILKTTEWPGQYIPIVPVYGDEINVEGRRIFQSLIHQAKEAQQSYNYWRTSAIEKVALDTKAPWVGPIGAFDTDADKWATANTQNHPYLEYDGGIAPQRQFAGGVPAGDLQMALSASDDMKAIMGIYDASLGARSNETSGIAIRARQREGDVSTFHFIDNMNRAIRHAGRILVDLIPKVYDTPRMIRVLGEDGMPAPMVPGQPPGLVPVNQQVLINDMPHVFDLTVGKYDVVVNSGPSFSTRREESSNQMIAMIQANPQIAPIIGDLVAKNQDWPGADEIAKRLQAMLPPQLQGQNPQVQQMQQQLQQQDAQAKQAIQQLQQQIQQGTQLLEKMQMQLADKHESNEIDRKKLDIDAYNAETNRIKATQAGMTPEQVQLIVMQTLAQVATTPDITPQPEIEPPGEPNAEPY